MSGLSLSFLPLQFFTKWSLGGIAGAHLRDTLVLLSDGFPNSNPSPVVLLKNCRHVGGVGNLMHILAGQNIVSKNF